LPKGEPDLSDFYAELDKRATYERFVNTSQVKDLNS